MTTKLPKHAFRIVFGALVLTFVMAACNNKASEKKTVIDSTRIKDSIMRADTLKKRPTAPGD